MKISVPVELTVMGQRVKIEYKKTLSSEEETVAGICRAGENLIQISLDENKTQAAIHSTLGHELLHFVFAKSGLTYIITECEEALVVCVEENLLPLMRLDRVRWGKTITLEVEG